MWSLWKVMPWWRSCLLWLEALQTFTCSIWEKSRSVYLVRLGMFYSIHKLRFNFDEQMAYWLNFSLSKDAVQLENTDRYIIALSDVVIAEIMALLTFVPLISFVVGSCWLLNTIFEDITNDLCFFQLKRISRKNITKLKEPFCKMVECYVEAKELVDLLNAIHEFIFLIFFVWVLLNFGCMLLVIQAILVVSVFWQIR